MKLTDRKEILMLLTRYLKKDLFYNGKRVAKFEKKFSDYIGTKYAVADLQVLQQLKQL